MADILTPDAERAELEAMIQSPGWRLYLDHMDERWGPAALEAVLRAERKAVTPEEWPFASSRILDTFAGMRANVRWPEERIRQLKEAQSRGKVDRFAGLRRRPLTGGARA